MNELSIAVLLFSTLGILVVICGYLIPWLIKRRVRLATLDQTTSDPEDDANSGSSTPPTHTRDL